MQAGRKKIADAVHYAREQLQPSLTESGLERGQLSADDFVLAGNKLIAECPSWKWERGAVDKMKAYLPSSKQYLVSRNVPCLARVQLFLDLASASQREEGSGTLGDGWVDASSRTVAAGAVHTSAGAALSSVGADDQYADLFQHQPTAAVTPTNRHASAAIAAAAATPSVSIIAAGPPAAGGICAASHATAAHTPAPAAANEDDEYADLASFVDHSLAVSDPAALSVAAPKLTTGAAASAATGGGSSAGIRRTRSYDLYITYDNAYRVPRVWLVGFDERGLHLPPAAMLEDVSQDHKQQTATLESGVPQVESPSPCISIHPCRHAHAMKRILETIRAGEGGGGAAAGDASSYLFVFLKFLASIVPTLEYEW